MSIKTDENMNIVIVGHVDHGKSTIIGRLLADTNSLPDGKLDQVRETCRRNSKPFEYAFLLDALKDEQAQGITIDAARVFFNTEMRKYIIIDAPGHIEFLKNMVTGAARAEAALLVIDANEGVMENSKRHGYLLSMLGIKQVVVLVNKMDLIDYKEEKYNSIVKEYAKFLKEIGVEADSFIPVSGFEGDNIAIRSQATSWYEGETVLSKLDMLNNKNSLENEMFRMPVQGVYKFTAGGDDRRIISGSIDSGSVSVGDEVIFYPSRKKSKVSSIEGFNTDKKNNARAGDATGFTLEEQIYITRSELACKITEEKPEVTDRIKTKLFWLGKKELSQDREYYIKVGTKKVKAELEEVITVLDASTLNNTKRDRVKRHEVAEVVFKLDKKIAFDKADRLAETSRFVLIDNYEITGGGIIVDSLESTFTWVKDKVKVRDIKWVDSSVTREERAIKNGQKSTLILVSGSKESKKKELAKYIERGLFIDGRNVYYLGIGNILYGMGADIKKENSMANREEHIRRFAEASHLLIDAGKIVVATATDLTSNDMNIIKTVINQEDINLVWYGDINDFELGIDQHYEEEENNDSIFIKIKKELERKKIIFNPYN